MTQRYTIAEVVKACGLEECEIRFFEQVFREFLTFSQLGLDTNEFTQDHVDVLARIRQLIHDEGRSIDEVKRELRLALSDDPAPRPAPNNNKGPVGPLGPPPGDEDEDDAAPHANGNGHKNGNGRGPSITPYTRSARRYARVIAVTSGKGGVGKTFATCNLALAFAQAGKKVAIFDADLGLANVHILMGVKAKFNLRHLVEDNFTLEDIITMGPLGVKIISGGQGVREMANLTPEQRRIILRQMDRLEREVDVLLIDTGAGISENVLRFATFADEIIVVTTPNIAAAADGYSIIKILLEMEPNAKIGVIANMAQSMYHSKNVFNRINAATKKYLRYALNDLGHIVQDSHIETSCQARKPLLLEHPQCDASKCIRAISETILNTSVFVNERKDSAFGDLMGALKRTVVGV